MKRREREEITKKTQDTKRVQAMDDDVDGDGYDDEDGS